MKHPPKNDTRSRPCLPSKMMRAQLLLINLHTSGEKSLETLKFCKDVSSVSRNVSFAYIHGAQQSHGCRFYPSTVSKSLQLL